MNEVLLSKVVEKRKASEEMARNLGIIQSFMMEDKEHEVALSFLYPENFDEIENMGFEAVTIIGSQIGLRW